MDSPHHYESDCYSPVMVDDLLKGLNDWRNIQDIVRLTFKALSDVVRSQGQAIRDLERQLPLKVNRSEFSLAMSQKANSNDLAEFQEALESRVPYVDYQLLVEDKVSRSDVQYLLANKPSLEEVKKLIESKANIRDMENEVNLMKIHLDDIYRDINRKIAAIPSERELEFLHSQLKDKVSREEFSEAMEQKAGKSMVTSALQNKLDRFMFDELISQNGNIGDMQRILAALESKADYSMIEQLHSEIQNKADRSDFTHVILPEIAKKAEKFEIDLLVKDIRTNFDKTFLEHSATTDAYLNSFKADLEQTRRSLNTALSKKVDNKDLDKFYGLITKKGDFDVMLELAEKTKSECREIANEAKRDLKKSEDFDFKFRLEKEISRVRDELDTLLERHKDDSEEKLVYMKSFSNALKAETQRDISKLYDEIKYTQEGLDQITAKFIQHSEFDDLQKLVFETQRGLDKVRENFDKNNNDFVSVIKSIREETGQKHKTLEAQLTDSMSTKVNTHEIAKLLDTKLDAPTAVKQLGIKLLQDDISDLKKALEKVQIELLRKPSASDLEAHIQSTEFALEDVAKDMMLKCNIKDVCALLDMKANIDDTNKALSEIHRELDNKLQSSAFSSHVTDYNALIETLCAENCLGRWLWKSCELRNGNLVPWEIQSVNTAPDNFLWEKDKVSIITVAPGLYEILLGFYSRKKPTIQILVNGDPIMSAVNSSSYVVHHSSGKLKPAAAHPNGNISGLTLVDYIALPARARISIGYNGEVNCEGFIGLRKL